MSDVENSLLRGIDFGREIRAPAAPPAAPPALEASLKRCEGRWPRCALADAATLAKLCSASFSAILSSIIIGGCRTFHVRVEFAARRRVALAPVFAARVAVLCGRRRVRAD